MHPIPSDSDHSHAIETAGAGGVPLTVSVPPVIARAGVTVLHEVWVYPHRPPLSSSAWPTAVTLPPRHISTTASQTPSSPMGNSHKPAGTTTANEGCPSRWL